MGTPERPRPDKGSPALFPESSSLIVMLVLFGVVAVIALLAIVKGGSDASHPALSGRAAHGPADFKDQIDWDKALHVEPAGTGRSDDGKQHFEVPPPPLSDGIYPCSECHEPDQGDTKPHVLRDMHEDIYLAHGGEERWCFDCHSIKDRDHLRLANDTLVSFEESYRLCGQCHGTHYRDWREGIHGRRTGYWNGAKTYLLCAHCHDPHHPRFAPLKPLPPPVRPQFSRPKAAAQPGHPGQG